MDRLGVGKGLLQPHSVLAGLGVGSVTGQRGEAWGWAVGRAVDLSHAQAQCWAWVASLPSFLSRVPTAGNSEALKPDVGSGLGSVPFCTARTSPLASLSSFVPGTVIAGPALVL